MKKAIDDLELRQLTGCARLAKAAAKAGINAYVIWEIGDVPFVGIDDIGTQTHMEICADTAPGSACYDLWVDGLLAVSGLSLERAFQVLRDGKLYLTNQDLGMGRPVVRATRRGNPH